jgi:TatD DNase family protein
MTEVLIDTHCHLDFDRYELDRKEVIQRAFDANVAGLLNISVDLKSARKSIEIAERYQGIYAAVGVHPNDAAEASEEDLVELLSLLQHPKVVAVGEVGLDLYRDYSPKEVQRKIFKRFLHWSIEYQKPLIIHNRNADAEIVSLIENTSKSGWRGVFHCFSGDRNLAQRILDLGFLISFTGTITFKNSTSTPVVKYVPLDRLLLETDSPFLAPVPHRGKRNEPAYVHFIAQKIAEIKGHTVQEVARITTQNARDLFGIKPIRQHGYMF